jgi:hypothetical protein
MDETAAIALQMHRICLLFYCKTSRGQYNVTEQGFAMQLVDKMSSVFSHTVNSQ